MAVQVEVLGYTIRDSLGGRYPRAAFGVLSIVGRRARDILSRLSRDDFSNAVFPFGTAREQAICGATAPLSGA